MRGVRAIPGRACRVVVVAADVLLDTRPAVGHGARIRRRRLASPRPNGRSAQVRQYWRQLVFLAVSCPKSGEDQSYYQGQSKLWSAGCPATAGGRPPDRYSSAVLRSRTSRALPVDVRPKKLAQIGLLPIRGKNVAFRTRWANHRRFRPSTAAWRALLRLIQGPTSDHGFAFGSGCSIDDVTPGLIWRRAPRVNVWGAIMRRVVCVIALGLSLGACETFPGNWICGRRYGYERGQGRYVKDQNASRCEPPPSAGLISNAAK